MRPSLKLMALLDQHGALTAAEAGEMLGLSRSQTGRKCHDLVQRGWALTRTDPDDKRLRLFALTRAGQKNLDHDHFHERRLAE